MPTPEQSRYTPGEGKNSTSWGSPERQGTLSQMSVRVRPPAPPQRVSNPVMKPRPATVAVEQALNRLPFFVEYDNRFQFPAGTTTVSSTTAVDMNFTTDGLFYIDFQKFETWTDVKVQINMTGYVGTGGTGVSIEGTFTDQAGEMMTVAVPVIARFYFNNAAEHHSFYGERRYSTLMPGQYRLQFQWSVDANSFSFNTLDTIYASVTEMTPVPEF